MLENAKTEYCISPLLQNNTHNLLTKGQFRVFPVKNVRFRSVEQK